MQLLYGNDFHKETWCPTISQTAQKGWERPRFRVPEPSRFPDANVHLIESYILTLG